MPSAKVSQQEISKSDHITYPTFSYFIFGWICWTLSGVKLDFSKIGDLISSSSSSGIGFGEL